MLAVNTCNCKENMSAHSFYSVNNCVFAELYKCNTESKLSAFLHCKETIYLVCLSVLTRSRFYMGSDGDLMQIMPWNCFILHHAAHSGFNVIDLNAHSNIQLMLPLQKPPKRPNLLLSMKPVFVLHVLTSCLIRVNPANIFAHMERFV